MKRAVFTTIMLLFIAACNTTAQTCGYCRGGGRVKTRSVVSTYGINTEKIRCPNCNQLIFKYDEHWDPCPHCGGTGQGRQRNSNGSNRNNNSSSNNSSGGEDLFLIYLTPAEYSHYKNCAQVAVRGTMEAVPCNRCNGNGTCYFCKGSGLHPIQHPDDMMLGFATRCPICGATGKCTTCYGQRVTYIYTDKGKEEAIKQIRYYSDLVNSRMNK